METPENTTNQESKAKPVSAIILNPETNEVTTQEMITTVITETLPLLNI